MEGALFIFSNSAISLDGKLASAALERKALGSPEDRRRMVRLRDEADAILVGGQTFRTWGMPLVGTLPHRRWINAVWTRQGPPTLGRRWPHPQVELRVYEQSLEALLADLEDHGVERLLVEGGGAIIGPLLALGRLDCLHLTLCPLLLGGPAPTLSQLPAALSLEAVERVGDELFLRYRPQGQVR